MEGEGKLAYPPATAGMPEAGPPPPSYAQAAAPDTTAFSLSYVDFVPAALSQGGILTMPDYERFGYVALLLYPITSILSPCMKQT